MDQTSSRTQTHIKKAADISVSMKREMFRIFKSYYINAHFRTFCSDLSEKSHVFVVQEIETRKIVGFSTIKKFSHAFRGKPAVVYFSGDTIIDRHYWGKNSLSFTVAKFLLTEKIKNPRLPMYWNLISKGYKTYLLLTNNFSRYFPRFDQQTPNDIKEFMSQIGKKQFSDYYNPDRSIVEFSSNPNLTKDALKPGIAEISESLLENKKISYFAQANPNWKKGDELFCLGVLDWSFFTKIFTKQIGKTVNTATSFAPALWRTIISSIAPSSAVPTK